MQVRRRLATGLARPARAYVRHAPTTALKPLLLRRLLEPTLRRHSRTFVTTTADGVVIAGDTRDMIQRYLYLFGCWEPDLTAWLTSRLSPGRTFVDVGANIGYFSLLAARRVAPAGGVVAIEALPATFERLAANVERNHLDNVRCLNVAAGRERGSIMLYGGDTNNSGTTTTLETPGLAQLGEVERAPLAELLSGDEIATTRVVKVDVEGAEHDVLVGLEPALRRMPPDVEIVVEVTPDEGGASSAVFDLLSRHGLHAYRLDNDYRLVRYVDHHPPRPLPRFRGPVSTRMDVVFSPVDAESLV